MIGHLLIQSAPAGTNANFHTTGNDTRSSRRWHRRGRVHLVCRGKHVLIELACIVTSYLQGIVFNAGKRKGSNTVATFDAAQLVSFDLTLNHAKLIVCQPFMAILVTASKI